MPESLIVKRQDGKYEEELDDIWIAEYFEEPQTGLIRVEIFCHNVSKWVGTDLPSLEEAQKVAHDYYDTQI